MFVFISAVVIAITLFFSMIAFYRPLVSHKRDLSTPGPNFFYLSGWAGIRSTIYRTETFVHESTIQPAEY